MNWLDIGIVAFILYQAAAGFRRGIRRGVLDLVALIAALIITITQFTHIAEILRDFLSTPPVITRWLSFLGSFGVSMIVLNVVARLLSRLFGRRRSWVDRFGGFFLGTLRGALLVSFFLALFTMMPIPDALTTQIEQSPLAPSALAVIPLVYDSIAPKVFPQTRSFYEQLNRYLALPSTTSNTANMKTSPGQLLRFLELLFQEPEQRPDMR